MGKKYLRWQEKLGRALKRDPNRLCGNQYTPLQNAIYKDDPERVRSLLNVGADPNYCGGKGYNEHPLAIAIQRRSFEIVSVLLRAKADPEHHFVNVSMLGQAIKSRIIRNVEALLKHKANPNIRDLWTEETPVFHVNNQDPHFVKILREHGADLDICNTNGETALYKAALSKQYRLIDALLMNGANPNITPKGRKTILEHSMDRVQDKDDPEWKIIKSYTDHGSSYDSLNKKHQSLYHLAVLFKDFSAMDLYSRKSTNALMQDAKGNTPLHTAIKLADYNVFEKVISLYTALPTEKNSRGDCVMKTLINMNFFRYPSKDAAIPVIKKMIEMNADVNITDDNDMTLLHYAVRSNDMGFARLLLKADADPNTPLPNGKTVLEIAIDHQNLDLVDILLDHGADPDAPNDSGWTLLDNLAKQGDRSSPIVQRLIAGGGEYNKQLPANAHVHGAKAAHEKVVRKQSEDAEKKPESKPAEPKQPINLIPNKKSQ